MRWHWPFARKSLDPDSFLSMLLGGMPTAAGITVGPETALRVPAVAASVRTIAEACASLRMSVVAVEADGSETPAPDHPVTAIVAGDANDWTSSFELTRSLVVDALTRDAGGLAWTNWFSDKPVEVIRYRPGTITVEYPDDGSGEPSYRINNRLVPRQQIIHVRSTFDRCPVSLCKEAIAVALVMETHASRLFGRGARPGGLIRMKKPLGDEGAKRMIQGWKAAMEGADNSGKTALLWDDAEWQSLALSSVDAQFQQLRVFQLQEIARAFNIPAVLIGELSRATWSNSAEMQRLFLLLCLEPWLQAIEAAFRRSLFRGEDRKRFAVRIERDDFSKVDLSVLAVAINSLIASRVLSPNEGRDWLGMPARDGGDEFSNPNVGEREGDPRTSPTIPSAPQTDDPDDKDE